MSRRAAFIGIHLAVADIGASAAFYRMLGLELPDDAELGEHVEIDLGGGAHLALSTERVVRMYDPGWRAPVPYRLRARSSSRCPTATTSTASSPS